MRRNRKWVWAPAPPRPVPTDVVEKQVIVSACEAFIRDFLKPRFLPEIRPTEWNYVIDIRGASAGGRYRFMQRYKSGMEHNRGEEFDAAFARIDHMGPKQVRHILDAPYREMVAALYRQDARRGASHSRNRRHCAPAVIMAEVVRDTREINNPPCGESVRIDSGACVRLEILQYARNERFFTSPRTIFSAPGKSAGLRERAS